MSGKTSSEEYLDKNREASRINKEAMESEEMNSASGFRGEEEYDDVSAAP